MRIVETKLFKFEELSGESKKVAIEHNRDINVFDFDFENDGYTESLKEKGFNDAKISFSGFHSQGDGACFDATIDCSKFAETPDDKRIVKLINAGVLSNLVIEKTGSAHMYSHERTRCVSANYTGYSNIDSILALFEAKIETVRLKESLEIYKDLEDWSNDLQSDEQIAETLIANGYEFLETGKIYNP